MEKSYVYFVSEGVTGPVKIGYASDVPYRIKNMQTGNPRRLMFRFCIECLDQQDALLCERQAHKILRPYWIRGEWFSDEVVSYAKIVMADIKGERLLIKSLEYFGVDDEYVFPPHEQGQSRVTMCRQQYEILENKQRELL